VDAVTNEVIREIPLIYDVNTPCTAQTIYSGTVGITGDSFTGGFRLRENRNGVDIQTLNLQNSFNYATAIDFTNTNTNFTNGSWANFNQDRAALDAHWGAEKVLSYWGDVHGRNSIDGNGLRVLSYVHASPDGFGWNNGQWVGGPNNHFMQYGDGDGFIFNPLTSLDIAAHEMGHGITEFTAGLAPGTQESAALNEGFSDIWGACVSNKSAPTTKQTWLIGEEIFATPAFNCIRNMQNPRSTTTAEGQHPDTYHGQFWDNNGEPHFNSTVLSHWFFLLSQGGNGWNNGQTSHAAANDGVPWNVGGIGINNAELIAYRALSLYLNPSADYMAARNATISAARDIDNTRGVGMCLEIAVTNAWYAVGVGAAYSGNAGLSINGDNIFCTTSNNYTIPNLPAGATVLWQVSPQGIATPNTPNSPQTTLTRNGDGTVTLTGTVTICGNPVTIAKQINVGAPTIASGITDLNANLLGPVDYDLIQQEENIICLGEVYPTTVIANMDVRGASSAAWTKVRDLSGRVIGSPSGDYNLSVTFRLANESALFKLDATNTCGTTTRQYVFTSVNCGQRYSVFPNPASSTATITAKESTADKSNASEDVAITEINIYDQVGNMKKHQTYGKAKKATLNVSGLKSGLYFIEVINGKYKERKQLIIQR